VKPENTEPATLPPKRKCAMDMLGPTLNLQTHPYQCKHTTYSAITAVAAPETPLLALWLTQEETDALIQLCGCSSAFVGDAERTLFPKLGDLFRAFQR
jgi:hypothetical protein